MRRLRSLLLVLFRAEDAEHADAELMRSWFSKVAVRSEHPEADEATDGGGGGEADDAMLPRCCCCCCL